MGQTINLESHRVVGDVVMFDTDRSITGQDGESFAGPDEAGGSDTFPAGLAARLFEADPGVDHVFVASNQVVVRRPAGWDDASVAASAAVVEGFFRYYPAG